MKDVIFDSIRLFLQTYLGVNIFIYLNRQLGFSESILYLTQSVFYLLGIIFLIIAIKYKIEEVNIKKDINKRKYKKDE